MKNIALIGQSPAVYSAVKALLERDPSLGLTVISADGQLPYDRMLLPGLIDRSIKEKDIFCAGEDFYKEAQVQLVLNKEISRINFNRSRVFCADRVVDPKAVANKVHVDFDTLIMTDAPEVRLPPLKGVRRQGVFHIATLTAVKSLIRYLAFTETVVVEPLGFAGIHAALALKAVGKDVIIASRQESILSDILPLDRSRGLARALENRGVRVMFSGGSIEDIIGESEVKAVRFKTGKVVACDMIVLEDVAPDMRFLNETGISVVDRIVTSPAGASDIAGVYAIDVIAQIHEPKFTGGYWMNTDIGVRQIDVVVASLFGDVRAMTKDDLDVRDILESFFHPQELVLPIVEVTV
ncbi:MAG: FAD-dependent oxidoreductase [Candidatus Omnitrophica bacterium]|nr:FAD-dependent oxidoreductase [Candidatus Omnitrophota bacterium]